MPPRADEQYVQRLYTDFGFFLEELWKDQRLERKAPLSEIEIDIGYFAAADGKCVGISPHRGILAPRGLGKTHIVAAALTCWRLLRDPERKVLIPSKSESHAKYVISLVREWIRNVWFLQHLEPQPGQKDSATAFQVGPAPASIQPSVKAIGTDGMLEGNRAHTIIPDDIETDTNTVTTEARMALDERVKEFKDILYPDIPHAKGGPLDPPEIVYVGTYHHEESVYQKLADRKYFFQTWPIVYPSPGEQYLNLAPIIREKMDAGARPDEPVFPHRFGLDNIAGKKSEGLRRYKMQHKLLKNLGQRELYPLKLQDLIVFACHRDIAPITIAWGTSNDSGRGTIVDGIPCQGFTGDRLYQPIMFSPEWAPYQRTVCGIDPAGRGRDWTGSWVVSQLGPYYWLKSRIGLPGGSSEADMMALILHGRKHGAKEFYIESNADTLGTYRPMFEARMKACFLDPGQDPAYPEGWKAALIDDTKITHSTRQKEVRIIDTIEPVVENHRAIIDPSCLQQHPGEDFEHTFQFQYTRITRERGCLREDGCIDSLELCFRALSHALRADPEKSRQRERDRQMDEQIKHMHKLMGKRVPEPRMFTHR